MSSCKASPSFYSQSKRHWVAFKKIRKVFSECNRYVMARVDLHMIRRDIRYDPDFGVVLHALGITWQFKYVMQTLLGRGRPLLRPYFSYITAEYST